MRLLAWTRTHSESEAVHLVLSAILTPVTRPCFCISLQSANMHMKSITLHPEMSWADTQYPSLHVIPVAFTVL